MRGASGVGLLTSAGLSMGQAADATAQRALLSIVSSNPLSVFAAGTAYSLTDSAAAITFGTTSPALTINAAGTYLIIARTKALYNAATFAANQAVTLKLRRTNNTAADLTNGSATVTGSIITGLTGLCSDQTIATTYTTANANDSIALFGSVAALPAAGSLDVSEASIVAIRLQS